VKTLGSPLKIDNVRRVDFVIGKAIDLAGRPKSVSRTAYSAAPSATAQKRSRSIFADVAVTGSRGWGSEIAHDLCTKPENCTDLLRSLSAFLFPTVKCQHPLTGTSRC
jgi:hypothetical protein